MDNSAHLDKQSKQPTMCVQTYCSICTAPQGFTVVFRNSMAMCCFYSTVVLEQPSGLSEEVCLYHVFIDFKKAFDRVWHAALCATMKKYISTNLIRVIKNLYDKATPAVLFKSSIEDWFRTTVGVDTHQPP